MLSHIIQLPLRVTNIRTTHQKHFQLLFSKHDIRKVASDFDAKLWHHPIRWARGWYNEDNKNPNQNDNDEDVDGDDDVDDDVDDDDDNYENDMIMMMIVVITILTATMVMA